jgi:methyl-accepting chemotaxis protein
MKNANIKTKISTAFIAVVVIAAIISAVCVAQILIINKSYEEQITEANGKLVETAIATAECQLIYMDVREMILNESNPARYDFYSNRIKATMGSLGAPGGTAERYASYLTGDYEKQAFAANGVNIGIYFGLISDLDEKMQSGQLTAGEAKAILDRDGVPLEDSILAAMLLANDTAAKMITSIVMENTESAQTTALLVIIITIVVLAAATFIAVYIANHISKPLKTINRYMMRAGTTGDLSLRPENIKLIEELKHRKDEIAELSEGAAAFVGHVIDVTNKLEIIAGGDLTIDIKLLSEEDMMGKSLKHVADSLNGMFVDINSASEQVSIGARQIADGAQSLAQGTTQQAATIQQLSASTSEIAEKTKANAGMANKAAALANTIKGSAEKGSQQMNEMMSAVNEINQASQSISKVIKVIDDIAFQTNILALNAAVEAARAGQHGKGFAVVADEVRNLASKSAAAAKDTGDLISNSMLKAEQGARIATETSASLQEIVSGINESNVIISEIASSSETQTAGITQIHNSIDQVAQVIQQNSATAEESAAASEELSGQSDMLEELISQFKLRNGGAAGSNRSHAAPPTANRNTASNVSAFALDSSAEKY